MCEQFNYIHLSGQSTQSISSTAIQVCLQLFLNLIQWRFCEAFIYGKSSYASTAVYFLLSCSYHSSTPSFFTSFCSLYSFLIWCPQCLHLPYFYSYYPFSSSYPCLSLTLYILCSDTSLWWHLTMLSPVLSRSPLSFSSSPLHS